MIEILLTHANGGGITTEQIMGKLPLQIYKLLLRHSEIIVPLGCQRDIKPALPMESLEHQKLDAFPKVTP